MEMKDVIADIKTAFNASAGELKTLIEKQSDEIKAQGETTTATAKQIKDAEAKLEQVAVDLKGAQERLSEVEAKAGRPDYGQPEQIGSYGAQFTESDAFKGFNPSSDRGSGAFEVKSFFKKQLTAAPLGNTPAYFGTVQRLGEIVAPRDRMDHVRDLLTVTPTSLSAIEYVVETGFTNAAAPVPEFSVTVAGEKPRSALSFDIATASTKTIAHWLPVTRQLASDAPTLRGYIDSRLLTGLALAEDTQLLYGDGTGNNLQGIMTHPDVQVYTAVAGDNMVDSVRRAMTLARIAEYPVTGTVVHPVDWERIELAKGSDGHYLWVSVTDGGVSRLWRAPVVETTAVNQGEFLTGAFNLAGQLWDREQANIRISDQHADFFTKNLLAILAEERVIFTLYRPQAFVRGLFTAPAAPAA